MEENMFIFKDFIKNNIIAGVKNNSFTREKASLMLVDYYSKGYIDVTDIEEVDNKFNQIETTSQEVNDTDTLLIRKKVTSEQQSDASESDESKEADNKNKVIDNKTEENDINSEE